MRWDWGNTPFPFLKELSMILERQIERGGLYREYLRLVNGVLRLTDKECELVALFLDINDIDDEVFSARNRKEVQKKANVTSLNLNNHIVHLKKKGIIVEDNGLLVLNEKIIPIPINGNIIVAYKLVVK